MALKVKDSRRSDERKQAAIEEAVREDFARLNLLIPESLHRRLKLQAIAGVRVIIFTASSSVNAPRSRTQ